MAVGKTMTFDVGTGDGPIFVERDPVPIELEVAFNMGPLGGSLATISVTVVVSCVSVLVKIFI